MLFEPKVTAFLPTINPTESKLFYMDVLGLKLISEDPYALAFEGNGSLIRITTVGEFKPHPFAVLGFRIEEIITAVETLTEKKVKFEIYHGLDQDDLGIWTAPSKAKVAWFKDPDGNVLSLTQYPED